MLQIEHSDRDLRLAGRVALFVSTIASIAIGCSGHSSSGIMPSVRSPRTTETQRPFESTKRVGNEYWTIGQVAEFPGSPPHLHHDTTAVKSVAFPAPSATIDANDVWIVTKAQQNGGGDYFATGLTFTTNDPNCTSVSVTGTNTIPNTSTPFFAPNPMQPNSTTNESFTENDTGPLSAVGTYNESATGTCNDGTSATVNYTIGVVQIFWTNSSGQNLDMTSQTAYYGGHQSFILSVSPAGTPVVPLDFAYIWVIGGAFECPCTDPTTQLVQNYTENTTHAVVQPFQQSNSLSFDGFWISPSLRNQSLNKTTTEFDLDAAVYGENGYDTIYGDSSDSAAKKDAPYYYSAGFVDYNVLGPHNIQMLATLGQVRTAPNPELGNCGVALSDGVSYLASPDPCPSVTDAPGIAWSFKATAPSGGDGLIDSTQLIDYIAAASPDPLFSRPVTTPAPNTNGFRLDSCVHYGDNNGQHTGIRGGSSATWISRDAPGTLLDQSWVWFNRADNFETTFVYRPNGANSIWVPLGVMYWNWSGTSSRAQLIPWRLVSSSNPVPTVVIPTDPATPLPLPTWNPPGFNIGNVTCPPN